MGRRPKTNAEHKLNGTYRADRHGDRLDEVIAHGVPSKPAGIDAQAAIVWDLVVDSLPVEAMALCDGAMLLGLCRWWSLWRQYDARLDEAGDDAELPRLLRMSAKCWSNFENAATKFGLSPIDRAKLRIGKPADGQEDELLKLLRSRGLHN